MIQESPVDKEPLVFKDGLEEPTNGGGKPVGAPGGVGARKKVRVTVSFVMGGLRFVKWTRSAA